MLLSEEQILSRVAVWAHGTQVLPQKGNLSLTSKGKKNLKTKLPLKQSQRKPSTGVIVADCIYTEPLKWK